MNVIEACLLFLLWCLVVVGIPLFLIYVMAHFLIKYW